MSVFHEVWHRIRPLTPNAYQAFADFYAKSVVEPNRETLDVLGGWKFTTGPSNTDLTLYRFDSVAHLGATMEAFGSSGGEQLEDLDALFAALDIEETREISAMAPFGSWEQVDRVMNENSPSQRRYMRVVRTVPEGVKAQAHELVAKLVDRREQAGSARLVAAYEPIVGVMSRLTEIWVLPERSAELDPRNENAELLQALAEIAPEEERCYMDPLGYSRLR